MAMTDAEKEAKILEIGELCSEISRTNQLLLDIFRAGGVSNADWATLKAELQGWTTTQLANYAKKDAENIFTENSKIYINQTDRKRNFILYDSGKTMGSIPEGSEISEAIFFSDSTYSDFFNITSSCNSLGYYLSFGTKKFGSSVRTIPFRLTSEDNNVCFAESFYTDFSLNKPYLIINKAILDNYGNSVVHKDGDEDISGYKKFLNVVEHKNIVKFIDSNNADVVPENETTYGTYFRSKDNIVIGYVAGHTSPDSTRRLDIGVVSITDTNKRSAIQIKYDSNTDKRYISTYTDENFFSGNIKPSTTNTFTLGGDGAVWANIYAATGTISTSDERAKTEIQDIPENVFKAWSKVDFQLFKFKSSVEKKGSSARIHTGVIAQRIIEAFRSEGLDATRYGLLCYDEWNDEYENENVLVSPEVVEDVKVIDAQEVKKVSIDENGNETEIIAIPEQSHYEKRVTKEAVYRQERKLKKAAGSMYSVRYDECLAMECAYQRYVLNTIKTKLGI